ncbi:hypothetical protein AAY473_040737 [Plecturocebus cupreus]
MLRQHRFKSFCKNSVDPTWGQAEAQAAPEEQRGPMGTMLPCGKCTQASPRQGRHRGSVKVLCDFDINEWVASKASCSSREEQRLLEHPVPQYQPQVGPDGGMRWEQRQTPLLGACQIGFRNPDLQHIGDQKMPKDPWPGAACASDAYAGKRRHMMSSADVGASEGPSCLRCAELPLVDHANHMHQRQPKAWLGRGSSEPVWALTSELLANKEPSPSKEEQRNPEHAVPQCPPEAGPVQDKILLLLPSLEYNDMIFGCCNICLLGSSNSPTLAF